MVIAAHFEDLSKTAGKPRAPRRKLLFEAHGALESGSAAKVLVHNVSTAGILLESQVPLANGERIDIDLPQVGSTRAKVVWNSGSFFGCQFDAPISSAALSAAQLRGAVGQHMDVPPPQQPLPDESFGVRLHRLRSERGLTLSQIAVQLGVSKPTVWAWEQGKARPIDSRIEALANALGVTSAELLPGRDSPALREILAKTREQIAAAFGMSPEKVRIIIDL